jgi:SET domain
MRSIRRFWKKQQKRALEKSCYVQNEKRRLNIKTKIGTYTIYMVKYFHFHNTIKNTRLDEPLLSKQCAHMRNGVQCGNRCQIGLHHCWVHLRSVYKVRIKDTGTDMGKGLYADDGTDNKENVVFKKNQNIIDYEGEKMDQAQVIARYGTSTGPYLISYDNEFSYDCAIQRCAAGLTNHKRHSQANTRFFKNNTTERVGLKANKNIKNGTQLFVSYTSKVGDRRYKMNEIGIRTGTNTRKRYI